MMASYNTNFLNKLDNDYECNRSKMWYMSLRKALIVLKADVTSKSTKLHELEECVSKLKNPAYGLLIELANEKMRDVTKRLEDFFVLFEDYNKLERMCETLVLVTGSEQLPKQLTPPPPPPPTPTPMSIESLQIVQSLPQVQQLLQSHQSQQQHQRQQPAQSSHIQNHLNNHHQSHQTQQSIQQTQSIESQHTPSEPSQEINQQPQRPQSSFNSLSLTPKASQNQSPLSTPIRSFLMTTDLFDDFKTPDKSLVPSSPFSTELKTFTTPIRVLDDDSPSTASLSTPKPDNLSDPTSAPISNLYSNSYVVKDLMKDLKTPEKKQAPPPSPLSVVIASSGIDDSSPQPPVLEFNLSPARSVTPIFVSSTKKTSKTTTTAAISADSSPTLPVVNLQRGVMKSKRVSLEKFQHYNSIGLKRRAESVPVLARQRPQRRLVPKVVDFTTSSSSQNPATTQLLKNINVDQFLSKVHDKKS